MTPGFGYTLNPGKRIKIRDNGSQERFIRWGEDVVTVTRGQVVAIDGKTVWGSQDERAGKHALHLVSARASAKGFC